MLLINFVLALSAECNMEAVQWLQEAAQGHVLTAQVAAPPWRISTICEGTVV